jgi:hypothetical protein
VSPLAIAASALAVAAAGGTGWLFGRRRERLRDPEAVMVDAAERLAGFDPVSAIIGDDGTAALTVASDGRLAVLSAGYGRPSIREIDWTVVRATAAGIQVSPARGRPVLLAGVNALDVRRLAPAGRLAAE